MLVVEPIVLAVTIYLSVVYGLLYSLFSSFPIIWGQLRGFNSGETGLIFIGIGIGTTLGASASSLLSFLLRTLLSCSLPPSALRRALTSSSPSPLLPLPLPLSPAPAPPLSSFTSPLPLLSLPLAFSSLPALLTLSLSPPLARSHLRLHPETLPRARAEVARAPAARGAALGRHARRTAARRRHLLARLDRQCVSTFSSWTSPSPRPLTLSPRSQTTLPSTGLYLLSLRSWSAAPSHWCS